mmetsp:Transcript_20065/g.46024  ORF Transcript_20065/g.46024 Transcript_20065/m.46024 type:complete len:244 (+) Transcript_20065:1025-1756(+)
MSCFSRNSSSSCSRDSYEGRLISNDLGRRLRIAASISYGRFVAPRTMIGGVGNSTSSSAPTSDCVSPRPNHPSSDSTATVGRLTFLLSLRRPSQSVRNSDFIELTALPSVPSLCDRNASISSMNITLGANFRASWNVAEMSLFDSPNHLFMMVLSCTFTKVAWDSFAIALASIVLPVPGGPYSSIPLGGETNPLSDMNRSGRNNGKTTRSYISDLMSSIPPTSPNLTAILAGSITFDCATFIS